MKHYVFMLKTLLKISLVLVSVSQSYLCISYKAFVLRKTP